MARTRPPGVEEKSLDTLIVVIAPILFDFVEVQRKGPIHLESLPEVFVNLGLEQHHLSRDTSHGR